MEWLLFPHAHRRWGKHYKFVWAYQVLTFYTNISLQISPQFPKKLTSKIILQNFVLQAEGGGQPLASPGSCLEFFKPLPFIECIGQGKCNLFSSAFSYWLATIPESKQFMRPEHETTKSGSHENRISRCSVCGRRRPDELTAGSAQPGSQQGRRVSNFG